VSNDKESSQQNDARRKIAAKIEERRRWAELREVYHRCVAIAEQVWEDRLDAAQVIQDSLAQGMRDRGSDGNAGGLGIPVPLFTPRDREQFLKEVAATLLISADRRNLGATPEPKPETETAPEAAWGTDEGLLDKEAEEVAGQGDVRQPIGEVGDGLQSPKVAVTVETAR
jgi:hypothetical protein